MSANVGFGVGVEVERQVVHVRGSCYDVFASAGAVSLGGTAQPPHGRGTSHAGERGSSLGCAFVSMLYGTAFAGSGGLYQRAAELNPYMAEPCPMLAQLH